MSYTKTPTGFTNAFVTTWANLINGEAGDHIEVTPYTDKSVQVVGTFGVGGSVTIEGSNDGANWAVLTGPQGNDLRLTTAKIEFVSEATWFLRPRIDAGDGTTDLTVSIFLKE